jgi:hypothetical protein
MPIPKTIITKVSYWTFPIFQTKETFIKYTFKTGARRSSG